MISYFHLVGVKYGLFTTYTWTNSHLPTAPKCVNTLWSDKHMSSFGFFSSFAFFCSSLLSSSFLSLFKRFSSFFSLFRRSFSYRENLLLVFKASLALLQRVIRSHLGCYITHLFYKDLMQKKKKFPSSKSDELRSHVMSCNVSCNIYCSTLNYISHFMCA